MRLRLLSPSPNDSTLESFEIPKGKSSVSIGRAKSNYFCVEETDVSASHAKIEISEQGQYELVDLDSSNGTFVNENKIARVKIQSGDIIRFANARFFFEESNTKEPAPVSTATEPVATSASEKASEELASLKSALWEKDAHAVELQKFLNAEKSEKARISSELGTSKNANDSLTKNLAEANSSIKSLENNLAGLRKNLDAEKSESSRLSSELGDSINKGNTLANNLSSANATIESLNLTQRELQNKLESETSRSAGLFADFGESQNSNESLTQNLSDAISNNESLQLTQNDLLDRHAQLEKAIFESLDGAKSVQSKLNNDWLRWIGDPDSKISGTAVAKASDSHKGVAAITAILTDLKNAREKMRSEFDKIEAIWDKCGPEVEKSLANNCSELEDEITRLSGIIVSREDTIKELEEDLLTLRQGIDEQLRKAQTISREGIRCEIPEKMGKMLLATDTEEAIFRKIVDRLDTINELSSHYHKKLASRKIAKSLDALRDDFLDLLKEHSVTPFTYDKGAILTKRDSPEVDLIRAGHDQNTPYHMNGPVKVIQTRHPGMVLKVGDVEIVIKKAKVEIKPD